MKVEKTVSKSRQVDREEPVALEESELRSAAGGRAKALIDRLVTTNLETATRTSGAICRTCRMCW